MYGDGQCKDIFPKRPLTAILGLRSVSPMTALGFSRTRIPGRHRCLSGCNLLPGDNDVLISLFIVVDQGDKSGKLVGIGNEGYHFWLFAFGKVLEWLEDDIFRWNLDIWKILQELSYQLRAFLICFSLQEVLCYLTAPILFFAPTTISSLPDDSIPVERKYLNATTPGG